MTRKPEKDQVSGLSMENKTMSDKIPTNIWAEGVQEDYVPCFTDKHYARDIQYTLVHNNPEYHVIPKSEVDVDIDAEITNRTLDDILNLLKEGV